MFYSLRTKSLHKMKLSVIFVLFLLEFCESNDIVCGHSDNTNKSVESYASIEFYCSNFKGTLPVNYTPSFSAGNIFDKSKVIQLKVCGCNYGKVKQLVEEFPNLCSLDISHSGVETLDSFDVKHENLQKLNISHNRLTTIPQPFFSQIPNITEIHLSHNKFTSLSKNNFENLVELEYLDLSYNSISSIGFDRIFSDNHNLKTLRLENNPIIEFDWRFFPLIKRATVRVSWEPIIEFKMTETLEKPIRIVVNSQSEATVGGKTNERSLLVEGNHEGLLQAADGKIELYCHPLSFKTIKIFNILNNHIENPSDILRYLSPSLELLELTGSSTGKISANSLEPFIKLTKLALKSMLKDFDVNAIKSHRELDKIDISDNHLVRINNIQYFDNLRYLSNLNVQGNQLENAPELIQHLAPGIIDLKLGGNFVGKLNVTTFERLTNLKDLELSRTNLSFDDLRPFEPLRKLRHLDISHNDLAHWNFQSNSMTFEFTAFKGLERFYAADCKINNAANLIKLFGSSLSHLDLSGNLLGAINVNTFENIENLHILNLSNTNLLSFDFNTIAHEIELVTVDLSNCKLEIINISSAPKHLQTLYLNGNELKEIANLTRMNVPRLAYLRIDDNQLSCEYLYTFMPRIVQEWPRLRFISDSWEQKHRQACVFLRSNATF